MVRRIDTRRIIYTGNIAGAITVYQDSDSIDISIDTPTQNLAPVFVNSTLPAGVQNTVYSVDLNDYVTDPDNDTLSFSIIDPATVPAGLTLTTAGILSGTPTVFGDFAIGVRAADTAGNLISAYLSLTLTEEPAENLPPAFDSRTALPGGKEGVFYSVILRGYASDPEFYTLTFTVGTLPAGLSVSGDGIVGTPTAEGSYTVSVTATDPQGNSTSKDFSLNIAAAAVNAPPNVTSSTLTPGQVGAAYSVNLNDYVQDPEGDSITYTLVSSLPSGLLLSGAVISGTPTNAVSDVYTINISDGTNNFNQDFSLTVSAVNNPPMWSTSVIPDGQVGVAYSYDLTNIASDPDGDTMLFSVGEGRIPDGLSLSGSGVLSGTPLEAGDFDNTLQVYAFDGTDGTAAWLSFSIAGEASPPVFDSTTLQPAFALTEYSVALNNYVSDADGDNLTFTVGALPAGLTHSNGLIQGTPTTPGNYSINVGASDGTTETLGVMSLTVQDPVSDAFVYRTLPLSGINMLTGEGLNADGSLTTSEWTFTNGLSLTNSNKTMVFTASNSAAEMNNYFTVTGDRWYLLRFNLKSSKYPHATLGVRTKMWLGSSSFNQYVARAHVSAANAQEEILIPLYMRPDCTGVRFKIFQYETITNSSDDGVATLEMSDMTFLPAPNTRELGGIASPSSRRAFNSDKVNITPLGRFYVSNVELQIRGIYVDGGRTSFSDYTAAGFNVGLQVNDSGEMGKCAAASMYYFFDMTNWCNPTNGAYSTSVSAFTTLMQGYAADPDWDYCIGFYIDYENETAREYDRVVAIINAARSVDPDLPVVMVRAGPYLGQRWNNYVDLVLPYHNPFMYPDDTVEGTTGWAYAIPHMSRMKIPLGPMVINQPREGTALEDNIWSILAHGSKGYVYWRDGGSMAAMETMPWWSGISALNSKLESVKNIVGNNHQAPWLYDSSPDEQYNGLTYGAFTHDGSRYLIAANDRETAGGSQTVTVDASIGTVYDGVTGAVISTPNAQTVSISNAAQTGKLLRLTASGAAVNSPPSFSTSNLTAAEVDVAYSFDVNTIVSDPNGDAITLVVDGNDLPAGLSVSAGVISGTPTETGNFSIDATATDTGGLSATAVLSLAVTGETTTVPYTGDGVKITEEFVAYDLNDLTMVKGSGSPTWAVDTEFEAGGYLKSVGSYYTAEDKQGQYIEIPLSSLPSGSHYLWLQYYSVDVNDDSGFFARNDGTPVATYFGTRNEWKWYNYPWQSTVTAADNNVKIWVREPNFRIRRIVIVPASVTATPTGLDGFGRDGQATDPGGGTPPVSGASLTDIAGHYMFVSGSGSQSEQNAGRESGLTALINSYPWDAVNKTGWRGAMEDGRWDWTAAQGIEHTHLETQYAAATAAGMYLQKYLKDINFGLTNDPQKSNYATPAKAPIPSDMISAGQSMVSGNPFNLAACAKLHESGPMDRWIAFCKWYHDTYKHHASYRGITVPETSRSAFTGSDLTSSSSFTDISGPFSVQYKRMVTELATYMAPYILNVQLNYMGDEIDGVVAHCMQYANVEFGTPDSVYRYDPLSPLKVAFKTIGIYNNMRTYKNQNWIGPDGETREVSMYSSSVRSPETLTTDPVQDMNELWTLIHGSDYAHRISPQSFFHFNWHPGSPTWLSIVRNKLIAENWYTNTTIPSKVTA